MMRVLISIILNAIEAQISLPGHARNGLKGGPHLSFRDFAARGLAAAFTKDAIRSAA